MSGQAKEYYDQSQGFDQAQSASYSGEPDRGNYNGQKPYPESKPPPPYPNNVADPPPPYTTFDEAFKVDRPKYNDIWAGLLVRSFPRRSLFKDANTGTSSLRSS